MKDDLQQRWWNLEAKLVERFGKKPDVETVLFLIGIQEFGDIKEKFTKEQKQDLMHIAVCSLLSQSGFYELESVSPALFLPVSQTAYHKQAVYHFTGPEQQLDSISMKVLGVSIQEIKQTF